ncbi:chromate transporter [Enterococcus cecorum]|uniref:chromate transporter n=1 Tax=Enterococcus cecorum TaxID=44008 RepID=UPI001FAD57EC|nr:chromate transporter [Enterococcus cecorum]MCJ0537968.1 chromate transporter [Enterococcus cecorum]MCJ0546823.1 chromate transporter [Enterococcus cecorum]MCJ0550599.1 chromate transporter [Enterococcus cecorum]MCJ0569711.1 chromate transporter [Enterococcus cecorum]
MIYLQLWWSFVKVGLFSFGGGYAALPLVQQEVYAHHWLQTTELNHLITLSQMTPGPIAINAATFVGVKSAGITGAIVATLGCVTPSCIIVSIIAYYYMRYQNLTIVQNTLQTLRPAVIALILVSGLEILCNSFYGNHMDNWFLLDSSKIVLFIVALLLLRKLKSRPILVMVVIGGLNIFYQMLLN